MADKGLDFLQAGGQMGALMRSLDWSSTPIGAPEGWPQSLRTSVSLCLNSRFPILLWWGPELVMLYNDAYRPMLGDKHPRAMGQRGAVCWAEIWDIIGPMLRGVLEHGEATWSEDQMLPLHRRGFVEECYFTFTYSPIRDESGGIGGVFCAVVETTERVIERRRLRLLKAIADQGNQVMTTVEACARAASILWASSADLPFALLYLVDGADVARLVGCAGLEPGTPALPFEVRVDESPWPLREVMSGASPILVRHLPARLAAEAGPGPKATQAVVLPISRPGHDRPYGVLVAALSPRLPRDASYERFFDLLAANISQVVANAAAHEEEKRRAEALAELNRAKTEFFQNISHEFRTPLGLMLGPLTELIEQRRARGDEAEQLVMVQRNGLRLLKLVNTLLDFSRIEAGRVEASFEPTDLGALTADLTSVFRAAIEKVGLRLIVEADELGGPIYVDRDMWEKIVFNLVSNAFKHTFDGEIAVRLRNEGSRVALVVHDTGVGIPKKELPHVFDRFHRVRGVRSRTHEGTGIGLSLVHELAKQHGGSASIDSEQGKGTTVTVRVPRGRAHLPDEQVAAGRRLASTTLGATPFVQEALGWVDASPASERAPRPSATGAARLPRQGRVLLADDNADMREYAAGLLRPYWSVIAVADGAAALAEAQRETPDLILSDVMMPNLDGFGLLRALRADERTRLVPVVLLSARAGEEAMVEGLKAGADDYLIKPFSARELLARVTVRMALGRARAAEQQRLERLAERERAARQQAEEASRLKDEFLATVSHELRTPLSAVLGWAAILKRDSGDRAILQKAIEVIERNARSQAKLIDDILDVSRIVRGQLKLEPEPVDLATVASGVLDTVRPAAQAKGVALEFDSPEGGCRVFGDTERLRQIVWNLLSNAVKFTPGEGTVRLRIENEDGHVALTVSDTGCGIDPGFLPHVFEQFRQADGSTTRAAGGLGLGLAIVRHLVEMHGGSIQAASEGPGKGSTFTVSLPRRPAASMRSGFGAADPTHAAPASSRLTGARVLVIDDLDDARDLLTFTLRAEGATVRDAASASEALALLPTFDPDVVVSDIAMPEHSGYWLMEQIRQLRPQQKAIALTAFAQSEDAQRALAAGFHAHLPKPVDPERLVLEVSTLLSAAAR